MRSWRFLLVFLLIGTFWACQEERWHLVDVMDLYQKNFKSLAKALQQKKYQKVTQVAQEFQKIYYSDLHQDWLNIREPESQTRYLEILKSYEQIEKAAEAKDEAKLRQTFSEIRTVCLDCHYVTRMGTKKVFFDQELPDIKP